MQNCFLTGIGTARITSTKMESMRQCARFLGLRYGGKKGRLSFDKGTIVCHFWNTILKLTSHRDDVFVREPFERVIEVVEKYGPKIWSDGNAAHLFRPGDVSYPLAS
jgi:hypothetical protein